jgi:hypothetical protein
MLAERHVVVPLRWLVLCLYIYKKKTDRHISWATSNRATVKIHLCMFSKKNKTKKKGRHNMPSSLYIACVFQALTCLYTLFTIFKPNRSPRFTRFDCWLGVLYSIISIFSSFGYSISSYDSDFFLRRTDRGTYHYSSFCCMLIWSLSPEMTSLVFGRFFSQHFKMKNFGHLSYFFGLKIFSSYDVYYLTQAKYISDLLSQIS